jgi:hypothetical protein
MRYSISKCVANSFAFEDLWRGVALDCKNYERRGVYDEQRIADDKRCPGIGYRTNEFSNKKTGRKTNSAPAFSRLKKGFYQKAI